MGKGFDSGGVAAVKARLDLVEMVRQYVDLRPAGGRWTGPCPFHQETKPSFSVRPAEGLYYCFGCQAAGDAIDFYCRVNGLEFREGLEQLAEKVGVQLSETRRDPREAQRRDDRKESLALHGLAQDYYVRCLASARGASARDYIARRGLSPEMAERFGLGASPDGWHDLENFLRSKGREPEAGVKAGLLVRNEKGNVYDRFRGRLMFPIHSLAGQVIAFGARALKAEDDPKYLNSSESDIYTKGENLYGLFQARRAMAHHKVGLLTEGYLDVMSLHQFGFNNACGVLGTALTPGQVRRLAGFCSRVDLVFDGDAAGRKAALRSAEMVLSAGLACRVVSLPEGEDVDSLLQKQGADAFRVCLDAAREGLDYCLDAVRRTFAPKDMVEWAARFLKGFSKPEVQAAYIPRLAGGLGMSEVEFRRNLKLGQEAPAEAPAGPAAMGVDTAESRRRAFDRWVLRFVVRHPEHLPHLADKGVREVLSTDRALALWDRLAGHPEAELLTVLDEQQKRFYIQSRMEEQDEAADVSRQLDEIIDDVDIMRQRMRREAGLSALRSAAGVEGIEALKKMQAEILGRADE
ncbi:MAG: DNA primase [Thermodesulfobacteriota bacterium]